MFHNAQYVVSAYEYTRNEKSSTGNTVILPLVQGDTVQIKTVNGVLVKLFGSADQLVCSFSGALISKTVPVVGMASKFNIFKEGRHIIILKYNVNTCI